MCGIAGYINSQLNDADNVHCMQEMLTSIVHRGPDQAGYYCDDRSGIGAVRLAIVDKFNAHQPMCDATKRFWLVFNGEIYNFREVKSFLQARDPNISFTTNSDTEVILKGWQLLKEDILAHLNGSFAIALLDSKQHRLFLARDRFGKRPLYYMQYKKTLIFASEIKALRHYPGVHLEISKDALKTVSALWTPLPDQSIFSAVKQVAPATVLSFVDDQITTKTYYNLPYESADLILDEAQAQEAVVCALTDATHRRISHDVACATYLSGGLDSAIITSLAGKELGNQLTTLSLSFQNSDYDESRYQAHLVKQMGLQHITLDIDTDDLIDNAVKALWHAECPTFRTAFIPMYLLAKAAHDLGIKVILSGEGADEAFLGYNIFQETLLRAQWHTLATIDEKIAKIKNLYPYLQHYSSANFEKIVALFDRSDLDADNVLFSHAMRIKNNRLNFRLFAIEYQERDLISALCKRYANIINLSPLKRAQWLEYNTLLSGYLLSTQGERMSLAHGVELRAPFLDHSVVELTQRLPLSMMIKGNIEKAILKESFKSHVPPLIRNRQKQPYRSPDIGQMLKNARFYAAFLEQTDSLAKTGLLDGQLLHRLLKKLKVSNYERITPGENQALMLAYSLSVIYDCFCRQNGMKFYVKKAKFTRVYRDQREIIME